MITHWLLTGIIAKAADVLEAVGGKSKHRVKPKASAKPATLPKLSGIKTRPGVDVALPEIVLPVALAFNGELPKPVAAFDLQHIAPVAVSFSASLPGLSAAVSVSVGKPASAIAELLARFGVSITEAEILQALKTRSKDETPKGAIRRVLSPLKLSEFTMNQLVSLIFSAWLKRRTIMLEAA